MENLSNWACNGGCSIEQTENGYQENGIHVLSRTHNYQGPSQSIDGATLTATSYMGKVFVKTETEQSFEMMLRWSLKADGTKTYQQIGSVQSTNNQWSELMFSFDNSQKQFDNYDLKFYIQSDDPTVPYIVDEIYLVDKALLYPPLIDHLRDGDFELFRFSDSNGPWTTNGGTLDSGCILTVWLRPCQTIGSE